MKGHFGPLQVLGRLYAPYALLAEGACFCGDVHCPQLSRLTVGLRWSTSHPLGLIPTVGVHGLILASGVVTAL